ncbi:MAG: hypothetical protein ACPGSG_12135, partial [Prolixibacteraceae bacterium]
CFIVTCGYCGEVLYYIYKILILYEVNSLSIGEKGLLYLLYNVSPEVGDHVLYYEEDRRLFVLPKK